MIQDQTLAKGHNQSRVTGNENGDGARELSGTLRSSRDLPVPAVLGLSSGSQPVFEPVLDSEEAAALLHIHPKTLQRLARNGELPGFRIGKLWGFRASALNAWLEGRTSS